MTVSEADMPRVAAAVRLAGELLEMHGALMLTLTDDWSVGAKAANLDPDSRGNRWETDELGQSWAIPSDPTGEAVLHARAENAREMRVRMDRIYADAMWLRDEAHVLAPIVPPSTMSEKDERWCSHHLRVGICEPRHRGADCRACYEFKLVWRVLPPVALLRDRHQGKKWTDATIKAALEADGLIIKEIGEVSKAVRTARGRTGRANQNEKAKKAG